MRVILCLTVTMVCQVCLCKSLLNLGVIVQIFLAALLFKVPCELHEILTICGYVYQFHFSLCSALLIRISLRKFLLLRVHNSVVLLD